MTKRKRPQSVNPTGLINSLKINLSGFLVVLMLSLLTSCTEHPEADLILYNGTFYTLDSAFSTVEAIAIKDGKILATGSIDSIRSTYRAPQNIDLEGKFVYPGFNDAHSHFLGYAGTLRSVNLVGTQSFDEVLERIGAFQSEHKTTFITGRGWDQNDWEVKEFPSKERLDQLYPDIPVYVKRIDGHAGLANQAALDFAGIDTSTTVSGGIVQKKNGRLTGLLLDNAMHLVEPPRMPTPLLVEAVEEAQHNLFKVGLTTVTDAGLQGYELELLDSLDQAGDLQIRVYAMVADGPELLDHYLEKGKLESGHLKVSAFKFYMDGALGSRGALMLKSYADDRGNRGLQMDSAGHYLAAAKRLQEAGWQMCIHAIGDSANRLALDIYDSVLTGDDSRWRIEHAQVVHPSDLSRFGALGVIPSVQPTHATSDMYWARQRLGKSRMNGAYAYQRLLRSAGMVALGTDFPVEGIDPLRTFYAAVFRQDEKGFPEKGFIPTEKLTREQALRGMTEWPAYAAFEEKIKGKLVPGLLADMVVLDKDLTKASPAEILKARVLMTFSGGDAVFVAKKPE